MITVVKTAGIARLIAALPWSVALLSGTSAVALAAADTPILDEIIVTAEKREASLQDVPVSIVALDESALEKFGISEIEDFDAKIPNVVVNEYFGIATTFRSFIRGVGAVTVEVTQDPAVALYVDGVYVGSSYGGSFEATELERIEVLRGPQGTLYGRNATGGAINLISRKPVLQEWEVDQTLTVGRFDQLKSNTAANIPLGDKAALRLSFLASERDGTVKNTGVGNDFGEISRHGARAALRVEPSDSFTIDLAAEYTKIEDTVRYAQVISGAAAAVAGTGTPINVPLGPPGAPTVDVYYPDPVTGQRLKEAFSVFDVRPDDNEIFGTTLTLGWDIDQRTTLKSITGYRRVDAEQFTMVTGTIQSFLNVPGLPEPLGPFPLGTGGPYYLEFRQFTEELQLIGDQTLFGGELQYVGGLYYYDDKGENIDASSSLAGPKNTDTTDTRNRSYAIYGQVTYTPSDSDFHFTLGARYSIDEREAVRTNLNANPPFVDVEYEQDFEKFTPSFTLAYDINDHVNIYGKVVTGYRSGATSTLSFAESLFKEGAKEETITAYEAGLKGDFLQRRLRVNAAAFVMDYKDYQASVQTGPNPADRDILNVDSADIKGVEIDIAAALTQEILVSVGAGYLHTEFGQTMVDPGTGAPPTPLVRRLPFAPKWSYSVSVDYSRPVFSDQMLDINVNYGYQGKSESGIVLGTSQINDSKGLLDARISLSQIPFASGQLKLSLWGRNLTDEDYAVSNIGPFSFAGANEISPYGDPRTFGLTLNYNYN